jgi:subtilisin family serine protease
MSAYVNQSTVAILDQSTVAILDGLRSTAPAFGHGTMVAGLVHLVAPNSRLMPLKAFSADGSGSLYDVIRAIYYAVDHGAKVINMSFSLDTSSEELQKAFAYANAHRVICVSSAGNSGKPVMVYPAGYKTVSGIGSTNKWDQRSAFSNYGNDLVSLAAPGENLITTYPSQGWAMVSGTSFSTALVAGAAALLVQFDDNTNQAQADNSLSQARPLPGMNLGAGRLDLFMAVIYARIGHR